MDSAIRQKRIIWGWNTAVAATGIFPPWHGYYGRAVGYRLIFLGATGSLRAVDQSRLMIEWFLITVVAAGLYFAWPGKGRGI